MPSSFGQRPYNIDINQLGASKGPRFAVNVPTPYDDGLVVDIILNELHPDYAPDGSNVGMARIRLIPTDRGQPVETLNWAYPIETSIREYPLKNELVLVFKSFGKLFYTRRLNATNKITESSWPGLEEKFSGAVPSEDMTDAANLALQGGEPYRPWGMKQTFSLGDEFSENPTVRMVRANEGDLIIQGRFGNVMRLGSSLFSNPNTTTPEPNILLTVGQNPNPITSIDINEDGIVEKVADGTYGLTFEDINKDITSIWMVKDEEVVLEPATIDSISHLRSTESSDSTKYTGAQIFVNSDRLIFNSKKNEISLFSKREINLSAVESITIDSAKSVFITAERDIEITTPQDIILNARSVVINSPNDISQGTSGNYTISGKKIFIGSDGDESQPMVLGGELATWLQKLMDAFIVEIPKSISTLNPGPFIAAIAELRIQLGLPSVPQSAIFNSTSNFTSKTND